MPLNIDPKLVVIGSIAVPVLYPFFNWDFSIWLLVALGAAGYHYFDSSFISKDESEKRVPPILGPQQPFLSPEKVWEIGSDGTPIPKYQTPPTPYRR